MIRRATVDDLHGIIGIYNQAITEGFQTAFTEPFNETEGLRWLAPHLTENYPLFVSQSENEIEGWVSISSYRQGRAALKNTVEVSYFVHNDHLGKGIGTQLLSHAINAVKELQYKTIIAIILDKNIPSVKLAEKMGFEKWGYLPGVATFGNIECGHLYYGKRL